jgi:hypothetical protein
MKRAWNHLRFGGRPVPHDPTLLRQRRSEHAREGHMWGAREGPIRRAWRHTAHSVDRRVLIAALACIAAAEFAVAGYVIGEETTIGGVEASGVEQFYFQDAYSAARRNAIAEGRQRGIEAGALEAETAAKRAGARAGARRGAAAAAQEQAAVAAAEAAAAAAADRAERRATSGPSTEAAAPSPAPAEPAPAEPAPAPAPAPPPEPCVDAAGFPC